MLARGNRISSDVRQEFNTMTTLLHLNASARGERSLSRKLSSNFVKNWLEVRPNDEVIEREIGRNPPPPVSEQWIAAAFTRPDERSDQQRELLSLSDALIAEVERADIIVIGTPMYNYGMPSSLKAWFDQVIRINKTFSFDLARGDYPLEPILTGKSLVILSSSGEFGFTAGGARAHMNHLVPHIETCAFYLGISSNDDIHHIGIEYQEFQDDRHRESIKSANAKIPLLIESL